MKPTTTVRRTLLTLAVLTLMVLAVAWFIQASVHPPVWHTSAAMVDGLREMMAGAETAEGAIRLAERLVRINPKSRAAQITVFRERAEYHRGRCRDWIESVKSRGQSIVPLADMAHLVDQAGALIETAMRSAPTEPVSAATAATAPSLATDPNRTGVLPSIRRLIAKRGSQIRKGTSGLIHRAQQNILGSHRYRATFLGLSARQWLLSASTAAALLGLIGYAWAYGQFRTPLEERLASHLRAMGRRNPRKGIRACYQQIDQMLGIADKLTREYH